MFVEAGSLGGCRKLGPDLVRLQGMTAKRTPKKKNEMPRVHPELEGFNIEINSFGEVKTNYDLDKLNLFLNQNVKDKKFRGRDDIEGVPEAFKEAAAPDDEPTPGWGETTLSDEDREEDAAELPPHIRDADEEADLDDLARE